jgi:hypothetical protein
MKSSTTVQKVGWIIWWIVTFLAGLGIVSSIVVGVRGNGDFTQTTNADKMFVTAVLITFFVWTIITQILAFFMIKYLHRDNSYIYPIILTVLGFFGSILYLIPGIWGIVYTNHAKLNS